mmetsp:Transcript_2288/g.4737  ORF Transcript_2288/g.4737 Transcript_2288/m.4737 type:complete len:396 (+) Transcript_2288:74-1261(+)
MGPAGSELGRPGEAGGDVPAPGRGGLVLDDLLHLEIALDPVLAVVAADAALAGAPPRGVDEAGLGAVDPHDARLELAGPAGAAGGVLGEDGRREAAPRVVRQAERGVLVVEGHDGKHRAEDLLLPNLHVGRHPREHRRRHVEPLARSARRPPPAAQQARALLDRPGDEGQHLVVLGAGDEGADEGHVLVRRERVARLHRRRHLGEAGEYLGGDVLVDQGARRGRADLAIGPEYAEHEPLHRHVHLDVVEDDDGRLAPQLQRHVADAVRARVHHLGPRGDGAREGDLGHVPVRRQRRAAIRPQPAHHIEHPLGQAARLRRQPCEVECSEGRELRRLEHHAAPRGKRRRHLPRGHEDGVVPRHDEAHHPHRLVEELHVKLGHADIDGLALPRVELLR